MSDPEADSLRRTFPSYMAEGERLYLCGEFSKAAHSFSNALHLQNGDKNCLVARSKCFLKMGELEKSLKDAEASLQSDPTFCKGILQKAETLYTMGDFEFALVFYHRGYKLRPDQEFKVGIQKAQEAINNSVGSPSSIKLENKGDLSFLNKQAESMKAQQKPHPVRQLLHHPKRESKRKGSLKSEKIVRQLLGELYVDKEYLEKLLLDEDLIKGTIKHGLTVEDLIMTGINYLDTRSNFWRQQKPIYARERDRKLMQEKWLRDRKRRPSQTAHYILKSLEDIDMLLTSGSADGSLQKAEKVLKKVLEWNKEEVPNKDELVGNLYSCIGNAQIELGQMVAALQSHRKDLEIAKEYDLPDAKSRALDNIGRVFAKVGKFQQAIDTWEEKIPLAKTTLEKTWLFHEIGRCYLELDQAWQAQHYGEKSQQCAEEEGDIEWQLNASVLVAQAQVKLRDFESAVSNFEKALERAKLVHNNEAQQAIISALDDANKGIIEELKKTDYRETLREKKEREEATELETLRAAVAGKEKESARRARDEPEKVMKHWERELADSEKETEDELSQETLRVAASGHEENRQREVGEASSFRTGLGATGRDSGDVAKGVSRDLGTGSKGEENRKPLEVGRMESREIYRRPSELDQKPSGELSRRKSQGLESQVSEDNRRESEEIGKTELGETAEATKAENGENVEEGEKEDE
ncbi:tetratricopeptide repeat protein 25 isoform X1 [Zalophus californianus]|uniref:Outer dynein arm-docking complex subunit 4 n=1 Tax=Zalophus californianus TaxID=9704 RepID=A0A6J2FJN7_ZALCA|nr:tetratricopeptide repeat protein 25 isoform X1 [Zalophus californianus]XP_027480233.1 tetratricopeptide repeat protein 25 isoform X1 [Zalophus californianus]XP_035580470.1 tetratricopeptide repeat protein 25 isoform X1 [Zalophus californianus]